MMNCIRKEKICFPDKRENIFSSISTLDSKDEFCLISHFELRQDLMDKKTRQRQINRSDH